MNLKTYNKYPVAGATNHDAKVRCTHCGYVYSIYMSSWARYLASPHNWGTCLANQCAGRYRDYELVTP